MVISGRLFGDLAARNPWWTGPDGFTTDPQLVRLAAAPFQRVSPVLDTIRPEEPNVYTLRGPRQVGKTTLLKQLAARLVRAGVPQVLAGGFGRGYSAGSPPPGGRERRAAWRSKGSRRSGPSGGGT